VRGLIIEIINEVPLSWALAGKHPLQEELSFRHDEQLLRRKAGRGTSAFVHSFIQASKRTCFFFFFNGLTGKRDFVLFLCVCLVTTVESGVDGT
jgi:hypothetical protein